MDATLIKAQQDILSLTARIQELEIDIQAKYATKAYIQTYIEQILGELIPVDNALTENSFIAGYKPLDIPRIIKHFQNLGGTYTANDYRKILTSYDRAAQLANINPYIAIAQMVKETDWGRSWWSQRPRRNPAGLGVTSETSEKDQDKSSWAFDTSSNVWKKGYSFPSWEIAAEAHIGHLLAYMYKHESLSAEQIALVAVDPRSKAIAPEIRGTVRVLKDLDRKWVIGTGYGKSIAIIANVLRT